MSLLQLDLASSVQDCVRLSVSWRHVHVAALFAVYCQSVLVA
jgi:hypothetical protein